MFHDELMLSLEQNCRRLLTLTYQEFVAELVSAGLLPPAPDCADNDEEMTVEKNNKVLVGIGSPDAPGSPPTIVLGVSKAAWEFMQNGMTHTFDLRKVGVPVQIVMFGADSQDDCAALMQQGAAAAGAPFVDARGKDGNLPDLGIDDPTVQ